MINIPEIGIVDTRNIVKVIRENYSYDFSEFALTSFKRRIENFIYISGIKNVESFILKLAQNNEFFEQFLKDIQVESTEMFRDPSLWRWLRDTFLKLQVKDSRTYKIWVPECVSGEELFSLIIVLQESDVYDHVEINATATSVKSIEQIKNGLLDPKKYESSYENYKRYQGIRLFDEYVYQEKNSYKIDNSLLERVNLIQHDIILDDPLKNMHLIVYRNRLIYFNPGLQNKVLEKIYDALHFGGHLIVGVNEDIAGFSKVKFVPENINENVFKKR